MYALFQKYKNFIYICFYLLSCFIFLKTYNQTDFIMIQYTNPFLYLLNGVSHIAILCSLWLILLSSFESLEKKFSKNAVYLTRFLILVIAYYGTISFLRDFFLAS